MTISQAYLTTLYSSMSGAGSSILGAIYGQSSSSPSGPDLIQAFNSDVKNQTQDIAQTAAQPTVKQAIASFTKGVQSATSVDQLLSNPAVMNVLLTANGLGDQVAYTGLAKAALTSDPSDDNSLVNQLSDTLWKTAAQNYEFATQGLSIIQNPKTIQLISQAYAQTITEQNQDAADPGVANAMAFQKQASTITSVDGILGNSTLRTVVTVALGIPEQIAIQDLTAQEQAISSRVNIAQFKDPKFVQNMIQQYLINNANNSSSSSSTSDLTTLAAQAGGILV